MLGGLKDRGESRSMEKYQVVKTGCGEVVSFFLGQRPLGDVPEKVIPFFGTVSGKVTSAGSM